MSAVDPQGGRYAALDCGDTLVIYDRENHEAWIQSTLGINLDDL